MSLQVAASQRVYFSKAGEPREGKGRDNSLRLRVLGLFSLEEKAPERPYSSLPSCEEELQENWRGSTVIAQGGMALN